MFEDSRDERFQGLLEKGLFHHQQGPQPHESAWRYLESFLIEIAKAVGRETLTNSANTDTVRLPAVDVSNMEYSVDQIRLILPVLGIEFIRPIQAAETKKVSDEVTFELNNRKHSTKPSAVERDDEFIVLKGSAVQATRIGVGSEGTSYG